jgi:hypothetical protein
VPDANTSPATSPMASGGSITITLGTLCDSFGLNPYPDATPPNTSTGPLHGTVSVQAGAGIVTYTNNGDGATSDSFVLTDASDHPFTINVTIAAPTSPISVSPSSLPTPNVGVPYSQPLSASGGHGAIRLRSDQRLAAARPGLCRQHRLRHAQPGRLLLGHVHRDRQYWPNCDKILHADRAQPVVRNHCRGTAHG